MHTCTCTCMHIQLQVWCKICLFLLQTAKLESMQAKMKTVAMNHEKDIRKRESEVYTCTSLSLTHTHPPPPPSLPLTHSLSPLLPLLLCQREIVAEELEHISEQHQQLSSTFAAQSAELARVEREEEETRERLTLRERELATLKRKKERRASVSKVYIRRALPVPTARCLSVGHYRHSHLRK